MSGNAPGVAQYPTPGLIYPQFYFLYVMKSRTCLGKGVFRPTSKIFLSAFPAELLWEEVSYHG